jgi:hypothetical protein
MVGFSPLLLTIAFLSQGANAFLISNGDRTTTSALRLTTKQASYLVQASRQVYLVRDDEDKDIGIVAAAPQKQPERHRSFASRVFSLPSSLWHPHAKAEGVVHLFEDHGDNAVLYFPVVGFTFVKDAPGHSRPLAGVVSYPLCILHDEKDAEPVVGYYHHSTTKVAP